jgi:hypothetical protein
MANLTKKTSEIFPVSVDFENVLDSTESIVLGSSSVTAVDSNGVDRTSVVIVGGSTTVSGTQLIAKVQAGADGMAYTLTFQAVTNNNNTFEKDLTCKVKD